MSDLDPGITWKLSAEQVVMNKYEKTHIHVHVNNTHAFCHLYEEMMHVMTLLLTRDCAGHNE